MIKNPYSGLKDIPKNIWYLSIGTLINRSGTMVLPFLALYSTSELGISAGNAGLVLAFYGLGAFISAPFAGKLSDKFGALNLMKLSLFSSGVFLFAYSLVTEFYAFLILSLIWAIVNEAFRPASMSFLSSEITSDRRKTAFALNRLAINLGMSIGPVIGGLLSTINFSLLFYVDGITAIAAGLFMTFIPWQKLSSISSPPDDDKPAVAEKEKVYKNFKFIYLLVAIVPVEIVFFQHIGAFPLFVVQELGYTTATFGLLVAVNTVLIIFIEVPLNDAMRSWLDWKSLAWGGILSGLGFGILAFTHDVSLLILSIVIWTFGEMIFFPATGNYVAHISPEKQRGEYMGYFQMTFSFSFMVGPWLGTLAFEHFGSIILWTGCLVLGLISAVMMVRLRK